MQLSFKLKLILCAFLFLCANVSNADWNNRLVYFYCIPQLDRFQIQAVNMEDGFDEYQAKYKNILARFNLFADADFKRTCKINNDTFTISVIYDSLSGGQCGAAEEGKITIKKNGQTVVDKVRFNADCFNDINVTRIEYWDFESSSPYHQQSITFSGAVDGFASDNEALYQAFNIGFNLLKEDKINNDSLYQRIKLASANKGA